MDEKEFNQEFINQNITNESFQEIGESDLEKEFEMENMEDDIDFDVDLTPDEEILSSMPQPPVIEQSSSHVYQEEQDIDDGFGDNFTSDFKDFAQEQTQQPPVIEQSSSHVYQEEQDIDDGFGDNFTSDFKDFAQEQTQQPPVIEQTPQELDQPKEPPFVFQTPQEPTQEYTPEPAQETNYTSDLGSKLVAALENKNESIFEEVKQPAPEKEIYPTNISMPISADEKESFYEKAFSNLEGKQPSENVRKLIHLINTLPPDVSKKTGAIIIKHTMEAMGISIKELIAEAKEVKEEINLNIRNSMNEIAEARKHINELEYDINRSKNLSMQLDDLIGLFIVVE